MEPTSASSFAVGYGNGYGYPAAMEATTVMPTVDAASLVGTATSGPVPDCAPELALETAATAERRDHRSMARPALGAAVIVVLLVGALLISAGRGSQPASLDSRATLSGHTTSTSAANGFGLGSSVPDAPGPPIVLQDLTAPTTTAAVTTPPTTAAPSTTTAPTAPTVPPSTAPPSTTPPVTLTTPPSMVTPTLPPMVLLPSITSFDTPAVHCVGPFFPLQYIDINWTTQFATKVTLSIDGPGVYKTYLGASGSDSVPFGCPGSHTYLLTAYNASGMSVSQSVTIDG